MHLGRLEAFVVIAEERNITRAAARLHVAQPSLTLQLRTLERELHVTLVDRQARPLRLTPAGERLLRHAHRLLDEAARARVAMRRAASGEIGEVRVGYTYGGLYDELLLLGRTLRRTHPDVALSLWPLPAAEQLRALRDGRVDVLVSRLVEPVTQDEMDVVPLRTEHLVALLPTSHALARRRTVALAALSDEAFLLAPRRYEPLVFDSYLAACRAAGFEPRLDQEMPDAQTQALAVATGQGVALTGDGLAQRFPGVRYLPCSPRTPVTTIAAVTPAGSADPLVRLVVELVSATAAATTA